MKSRVAALAVIALVIAILCAWRVSVNRPQSYEQQLRDAVIERPAPVFEGLDAHNEMFRLQRYLGRHRVLVVFYRADDTVAADPNILAVRGAFAELERNDVKVVGVSTALPQQNRAAMEHIGELAFPVVSDVDLTIHRRWGRLTVGSNEPLPGVFLISRKGTVASVADLPRPVEDVPALLKELTR